jgi:Big-like domain-containing protein
MKRSSVVVALVALGQLSCSGSQPTAPTSSTQPLSITGVVTLGEVHPSVQLTLSSGNQDVTNSATWLSSNTSVATVSSGLVRATGLGTTTISAAYKGQTVSSAMSTVPDQDCIPYDPTNVSAIPDRLDPTAEDITSPVPSLPGFFGLLAGADNPTDAKNLVALFQRYSQVCYIGRNYGPRFTLTYFKGASGQQTTIAPEDCVAYSAGAVQVVNQGANGWAVMSGGTQLFLINDAFEATLASAVAAQASNECFIGRGNTRPNPYGFITEYWK